MGNRDNLTRLATFPSLDHPAEQATQRPSRTHQDMTSTWDQRLGAGLGDVPRHRRDELTLGQRDICLRSDRNDQVFRDLGITETEPAFAVISESSADDKYHLHSAGPSSFLFARSPSLSATTGQSRM
jgi:hypothetical protein